jgi:exonuclease SbcC
LETQIAQLGEDDSLLGYLKHNFKDVLQAETYAEISADIRFLQAKYPVIEQDADALLKKYAPQGQAGEQEFDIDKINLAFKEIEQKRKALKQELEQIEKRKRAYDDVCSEMKTVETQGKYYSQSHQLALEKIAFLKDLDSEENLERKLKIEQASKERAQKSIEEAQENLQRFHAAVEKQRGLVSAHEKMEISLEEGLKTALQESGFVSTEEARSLIVKLGDEQTVKAECKAFFEKYELYKSKKEETDEKKFVGINEETLQIARAKKLSLQEAKDTLNRQIATAETELKQLLSLREKYQAFEKALVEKEKRKNICDELRLLLRNNRFLEFIASEYLQEICVSASKTLLSLTGGRYFLRYEKEFKVGDNLDGGNQRAVRTLSGGETFLVSLSLALSLSGAICQKSLRPIEFFFLDEGFGTLDEKLVDTVMDVLGKLSKNFSVGLISHVEELKHRIDNKILVTGATETHGSRVNIEHF